MNETVEAIAQAIFKELFPYSLGDSLPKGWRVGKIGDLCEVALGGAWGEESSFSGAVEVVCLRGVDLEHLRKNGFADAPRRWVRASVVPQRRLDDCDVLVAGSGAGPTGRPLWAAPELNSVFSSPVIYSNFCKRLRCRNSSAAVFIDRCLYSMRESGEIWEYVNGTSIPNLDANALLKSKRIVIPPESVLEAYASIAKIIFQRLYSGESRTIASVRDALLPKLLSGEVRAHSKTNS